MMEPQRIRDIIAVEYLPKLAASLSIVCSTILITEVLQDFKTRTANGASGIVSRILLSISAADLIFSFGWFLGTWVSDKDSGYNRYGTHYGTKGTCAVQGFILQFGGMVSLLTNASLATFFLLMIKQNYPEGKLKTMANKSQIIIWIISFGIACIPLSQNMYHASGPACWIAAYPQGCKESWDLPPEMDETNCIAGDYATLYGLALQVAPVTMFVFIDAIIMCRIYAFARKAESHRTTSTETTGNNIESNVDPTASTMYDANAGEPSLTSRRRMKITDGDLVSYGVAPSYHSSSHDLLSPMASSSQRGNPTRDHARSSTTRNRNPTVTDDCYGNAPSYQSSSSEFEQMNEDSTAISGHRNSENDAPFYYSPTLPALSSAKAGNNENDRHSKERTNQVDNQDDNNKSGLPSLTKHNSHRHRRQRSTISTMLARQGVLFIASFLLTFGVMIIATFVFIIAGQWNDPLDRIGYFLAASQGVWNFIVFSRGRRMKTNFGAKVKRLIWRPTGNDFRYSCRSCCCSVKYSNDVDGGVLRRIKEYIIHSFGLDKNGDRANSGTGQQGIQLSHGDNTVRRTHAQEAELGDARQQISVDMPLVVESAEIAPSTAGTSSSDLDEMIRYWVTERFATLQRQDGFAATERQTANDEDSNVEATLNQRERLQLLQDLRSSILPEFGSRDLLSSHDYDSLNTDEPTPIRPGAFRIGPDGYPIQSEDEVSHFQSLEGLSTATPHATPVVGTNSKMITEDDIIRIIEEQLSVLLKQHQQNIQHATEVAAIDDDSIGNTGNGDGMDVVEKQNHRLVEREQQSPEFESKFVQRSHRANTGSSISNFSLEGEYLNARTNSFVNQRRDGSTTRSHSVKISKSTIASEASDIVSLQSKKSSATTTRGESSEATDIKSTFD